MKLTTNDSCSPITVDLLAAPDMKFRSAVPCGLGADAVRYAVCRFIAHSPRLAGFYAAQSCALRFESDRKKRRARTFRCTAPAILLELPGAWAVLRVRVDPDAVTVTALELTDTYPLPSLPKKEAAPKIGVWLAGE